MSDMEEYESSDGKSDLVKMVEELEAQASDQQRKLEDKTRLTKFTDKANSQLSTENKELKGKVVLLEMQLNNAIAAIHGREKR